MPVFKVKAGDFTDTSAAAQRYAGPLPPVTSYLVTVKSFGVTLNSNDDPMFKVILEIAHTKNTPKAKFNGFPFFHNANITKQGAPYVNQMLDAMGLSRKAVWVTGFTTDKAVENGALAAITKLGTKKDPGDGSIQCIVSTRRRKYKGDWQLEITSFAPYDAATDEIDSSELPDADATLEDDDLNGEDLTENDDAEGYEDDSDEVEEVEEVEDGEESDDDELTEEEETLYTELEGLNTARLKARAKANGAKLADYKGLDNEELMDLIVSQELGGADDEDEPEEEESEPEEEEAEEEPAKPARRRRGTASARSSKTADPY